MKCEISKKQLSPVILAEIEKHGEVRIGSHRNIIVSKIDGLYYIEY